MQFYYFYILAMLKKFGIYAFLLTFIFQAVFFNMILFAGWSLARLEAETEQEADGELVLTKAAAKQLRWLNENEFLLGGHICDVHKKSTEGNIVRISFKADEKEQGFLEKMAGHCKQNGSKKIPGFTAPCPAPHSLSYTFKSPEKEFSYFTGHPVTFLSNKADISSPPPKIGA
jgi:hypothetical protein